mgnify:CR=1 FL=1
MRNEYQLSKREQRVMDLLWEKDEALTSVDILERLSDIMPNTTYVHRTINALLDAGLIQERGSVRYNTQYARKFVPCMTREEYAAKFLVLHGIQTESFVRVAMALFQETQEDKNKHADEMIEQLQEIIDALKAQAKNPK